MALAQSRIAQKPHLLKIIPSPGNSIIIKGDEIVWNNPWHFHPEIELLYCITAKGTNFIGNYINPIEEGEILLLGKNLPHTRQRDKDYYRAHPDENIRTIVIQFKENFLGDDFFSVREFAHIRQLLDRAQQGIKLKGSLLDEIKRKLTEMANLNETTAIIELLSVLDTIARSDDFILLNPVVNMKQVSDLHSWKVNTVYVYTAQHFKEPVSLASVADLINLTPSAFCRYFKMHTRKSYFDYLSEVRISYACELLMENHLDISEICFSSGFNSLSNFHKLFKRIVKLTPSAYREKGKKKISEVLRKA
ncbi:AraC family transcriptional regulator [Mucilaginibacter sp. SMC90]|uniref:AraC family transcriptional regulator n=1 Tax=Mucilaginibacter sp. SMC90 TaxID=2929803 RepID=UPI001FB3309B|nr:AraC family transcriptional regulator [Mucilaginibacter sp. SMC90]UOE51037.1 AraC family transcriptional regulator [Mucilaginibacter sp. SMC90]